MNSILIYNSRNSLIILNLLMLQVTMLIYNSRNSLIILNKEIVDNELVISTTVEIL